MKRYTIWVGGNHPFDRCYFSELGAVELTTEQIEKYFSFDDEGNIMYDKDLLCEVTEWETRKDDMPTWDTITDGSLFWGPYADDQKIGVCVEGDEDNPVFLEDISTFAWYSPEDIENNAPEDDEVDTAIGCLINEFSPSSGVWILYNSYERGGYVGEFELPEDEEFDPKQLVITINEVAESWSIVSGATYKGEDIYFDGDTIGKGIDWYVYYNYDLECFR